MKEKRTCLNCNCDDISVVSRKVRDSKKHIIIKCNNCGLVQLNPIPTNEEINEYYNLNKQEISIFGRDYDENKMRRNARYDTIRRTNLINSIMSHKGKILDIGCGYNFLLDNLKNIGYYTYGIEISKERRNSSNHTIYKNLNEVNTTFDCITLFFVLEHIPNPVEYLKKLSHLLKPQGKIIIEVPNLNDKTLSNKEYNQFFWQLSHMTYFNEDTLKNITRDAGYLCDIMYQQRYSIENMFYWKLIGKPQIHNPIFDIGKDYKWLEKCYKSYLIKNKISDTLIGILQ